MTIQLTLGIMNPLAMIIVAMVIAAEKLLPRPAIIARLVGFGPCLQRNAVRADAGTISYRRER